MRNRLLSVLVVALGLAATVAAQSPPRGFRYERPVVTSGAGAYRLAMDVPLLVGAGDRATDLRLFDASNREVPYLFVRPARAEPVWVGAVLLAIAETKTTSGFEADLGEIARVDAVKLQGLPSGFLKRLVLEGSGDRSRSLTTTRVMPCGTMASKNSEAWSRSAEVEINSSHR